MAGATVKGKKKRVNHDDKMGKFLENWSLLHDIKLEQVKVPPGRHRSHFKLTEFSLNNHLELCKICHQTELKPKCFQPSVFQHVWDKYILKSKQE